MKSSSKALLGLAALLLLPAVAVVLLRAPNVPDQTQIVQQMEAARAAGERHDINGFMGVVSSHYHDSSVPSPVQLRFLLNRVKGEGPLSVTQTVPVVDVRGDDAATTNHLRIVSADGRVLYDHDVTLQWKREDGTRFGVLPTKVWRITTADYGSPFGDF